MGQLVQVCGSVLVLVAFALAQRGVLDQKSPRYLVLHVEGSKSAGRSFGRLSASIRCRP